MVLAEISELKEQVEATILEHIDGLFYCSDDFIIVEGWMTVAGIIREWSRFILPDKEFKELSASVRSGAEEAFRLQWKTDPEGYVWDRFLREGWRHASPKYVVLEGYMERVRARAKVTSNTPFSNDELLETYPLYDDDKWGFSDEYSYCSGCLRSIRTSPDCYSWKLEAWQTDDGELFCPECVDPDEYIEAVKNQPKDCNLDFSGDMRDWERVADEHGGFVSFRNGYHHGMNDSPEKQITILNKAGIDVLFTFHPSQFYTEWELWVPDGKSEEAWRLLDGKAKCDVPAEVLKKQLQSPCTFSVPQEWLLRFPQGGLDERFWEEFKKRLGALPQPVSSDDWLRLAEAVKGEM